MEVPFWVVRNVSVYLNYSSVSFFAGNSFVSSIMIRIRTTATEKIPSMPSPITLRDSIKLVIINRSPFLRCMKRTKIDISISEISTADQRRGISPKISPPAITEAI